MTEKEQMFYDIGIVDFVVVELTEFLDVHPDCAEALEYFKHYSKIRNQMVEEFSQKYFPISVNHADCSKEWTWGAAPLPWENCPCAADVLQDKSGSCETCKMREGGC